MEIHCNRPWKLLIDKGLNKTQLKETAGLAPSSILKMGRNKTVSMETMLKYGKP